MRKKHFFWIFLILFGTIFIYINPLDLSFAVYARGGDSGTSPMTINMIVELAEGDVITGCSASGKVEGYQQCSHECVGHNDRGYCEGIGSYDTDTCPAQGQHCLRSFDCYSVTPISVTVGGQTVPIVNGEFNAGSIGFEGYTSNFGVTFTANPGGRFSNLKVNCGEGACQPNWVYEGWGSCHEAGPSDIYIGPFIRARWRSDTVCGLPKEIEKEACCNADEDCGACDKECISNQCVDVSLPDPPDDCSVFLPFPGCVWDDSACGCHSDDECVDFCFGSCEDRVCVYPLSSPLYSLFSVSPYSGIQPIVGFEDCAEWCDIPDCDWDYSSCDCESFCYETAIYLPCIGLEFVTSGTPPDCVCDFSCEEPVTWYCFDLENDLPSNECEAREKIGVFASQYEKCYSTLNECIDSYEAYFVEEIYCYLFDETNYECEHMFSDDDILTIDDITYFCSDTLEGCHDIEDIQEYEEPIDEEPISEEPVSEEPVSKELIKEGVPIAVWIVGGCLLLFLLFFFKKSSK